MRTVVACAIAVSLVVPMPAVAAPGALSQKKAQHAAAIADLKQAQADVQAQVAEYVALGRRIEEAQAEVAQVDGEIAALETQLTQKEASFKQRAIQMYRTDRIGVLEVLLGSNSFQDFWSRAHYLVMINQRDNDLIRELRLARSESLWLQNSLGDKIASLTKLQQQAEKDQVEIEDRVVELEQKAAKLGEDVAELMKPDPGVYQGSTPSGVFDKNTVISDAQFRASGSMTAADIQAFLERQPGTLKSYRAADHNGEMKSTAEMIAEAAVAWNVSPKVILVKLQKEQSLLAKTNPKQKDYDWAMGCGRADSKTYYEYQGFGKQIWWGAQKLNKNANPWTPGISMKIDSSTVIYPTNASTYSLYKYTPHYKGTFSFWMIYWRYFGDPLAS